MKPTDIVQGSLGFNGENGRRLIELWSPVIVATAVATQINCPEAYLYCHWLITECHDPAYGQKGPLAASLNFLIWHLSWLSCTVSTRQYPTHYYLTHIWSSCRPSCGTWNGMTVHAPFTHANDILALDQISMIIIIIPYTRKSGKFRVIKLS